MLFEREMLGEVMDYLNAKEALIIMGARWAGYDYNKI